VERVAVQDFPGFDRSVIPEPGFSSLFQNSGSHQKHQTLPDGVF
jgi:hypothetical protein